MPRDHGDTGHFVTTLPPEDVGVYMRELDRPAVVTSDVADRFDVTRETARRKLGELIDAGRVKRGETAGRVVLYWLADTPDPSPGERQQAPRHEAEPGPEPDTSEPSTPELGRKPVPQPDVEGPEVLAGVDFPRDREACERAVYTARAYLQEYGAASMRELVRDVMPEYPIGYDVPDLKEGGRYRGAWWRKVVKPGLEALPDVEPPAPGASDWRAVE